MCFHVICQIVDCIGVGIFLFLQLNDSLKANQEKNDAPYIKRITASYDIYFALLAIKSCLILLLLSFGHGYVFIDKYLFHY